MNDAHEPQDELDWISLDQCCKLGSTATTGSLNCHPAWVLSLFGSNVEYILKIISKPVVSIISVMVIEVKVM